MYEVLAGSPRKVAVEPLDDEMQQCPREPKAVEDRNGKLHTGQHLKVRRQVSLPEAWSIEDDEADGSVVAGTYHASVQCCLQGPEASGFVFAEHPIHPAERRNSKTATAQ